MFFFFVEQKVMIEIRKGRKANRITIVFITLIIPYTEISFNLIRKS